MEVSNFMDGLRPEITDATLTDDQVVTRVLNGDIALWEIVMRRYNQRLFRVVRSILKDDSQAEDIVQEAYVRAYEHLSEFEGRAKFSTWLTKIAIYEAYARLRRFEHQNVHSISELEDHGLYMKSNERDPERRAFDGEVSMLLERAFDSLSDDYRSVFMLREIEGLSTAETAECLDISEDNVKTRLHRARTSLQRELYSAAGATTRTAFQFLGPRCDRLVARVMTRIQAHPA
jgi:RNA polymerase sigma-70 factor, ECF subfamily